MTNHIEEMMRTAGIKKDCMYTFYTYENKNLIPIIKKQQLIDLITYCKCKGKVIKTTNSPKTYFPDFTPKKQLELENLIIKKKFPVWSFSKNADVLQYTPFGYFMEDNKIFCMCGSGTSCKIATANNREQALAQLTTELMKAGKLDTEKVKEILEG